MSPATQALIEKIEALPADRLAEVEDFVDFIREREQDRHLVNAAKQTSTKSFATVWNNPEDDVYNSV